MIYVPIENCPCGGSQLARFYSLFTCDGSSCSNCRWNLNRCCNSCQSLNKNSCCDGCLNFYDIEMTPVVQSRIKSFGYCDNHKALGVQFQNGEKRLYLNVEREVYDGLVNLNKDLLYMYLKENIDTDENQCVIIS